MNFYIDENTIRYIIKKLALNNNIKEGNIKLILHFENKASNPVFLMYFIPHAYPSSTDVKLGVKTILFNAERKMPNAKIVNLDLRFAIEKLVKNKQVYEALLVNSNYEITEGNKSNLFFISNNEIITPPKDQILPGITRKYVFLICERQKIKISEKKVPLSELENFDSVFLTGTSPKILPIAMINDFTFKVNNTILERLIYEYDQLIHENIY